MNTVCYNEVPISIIRLQENELIYNTNFSYIISYYKQNNLKFQKSKNVCNEEMPYDLFKILTPVMHSLLNWIDTVYWERRDVFKRIYCLSIYINMLQSNLTHVPIWCWSLFCCVKFTCWIHSFCMNYFWTIVKFSNWYWHGLYSSIGLFSNIVWPSY